MPHIPIGRAMYSFKRQRNVEAMEIIEGCLNSGNITSKRTAKCVYFGWKKVSW